MFESQFHRSISPRHIEILSLQTGLIQIKVLTTLPMTISSFLLEFQFPVIEIKNLMHTTGKKRFCW